VKLDVHVYTISLRTDEARLANAARVLSEGELDRANRFHRARDRERFVAAHAETRRLLAILSGTEAAALEFTTMTHGKPFIANPSAARRWMFNLSHSGDFALLAAAPGASLGVDIEEKRDIADLDGVAERFFSAAERAMLASADEPPADVFFAIWTRKEAVIKALGYGLHMPLAGFDVCEPGHWHDTPVFRLDAVDGLDVTREGWRIHALATPDGYAGALATVSSSSTRVLQCPAIESGCALLNQ
jgi:4'-phosphopantetheinyl transferase